MGDVLAKIFAILDKIRVLLDFAFRSIFAAVSFLWRALTWVFDLCAAFPLFAGVLLLSVSLAVVLLIVGR